MSTSARQNPSLCWKCQALLNTQYPESLVKTEHNTNSADPENGQTRELRTSDSVESTASDGCLLCLHLLNALSIPARVCLQRLEAASRSGTLASKIEYENHIVVRDGHEPSLAMYVNLDGSAPGLESGNEIKTVLELFPEAEAAQFANHGDIHDYTYSDTSKAIVMEWLDRCTKTHGICSRQINRAARLPSRLVDISSGAPRLLVVQDSTPTLPYATMSHCWGSNLPFRLLSTNMDDLQVEIPVAKLSRSFGDALQVLRWLDLSYIWIDCLCIIQDSIEDWEKESASMADVYSNSYCNIAAAHAADGTYGCFVERDPRLVKPLKVELCWGPRPGTYYTAQWLYWRQKVIESPLNLRAWVCQERFLAPRNVFFGDTQLHWECFECTANETFPVRLPANMVGSVKPLLIPPLDGGSIQQLYESRGVPEIGPFNLWDHIVRNYSSGKLTHSKDKLVAISGLASRMQKHTQSEYLAGLWRKHLPYQLLWTVGGVQWVVRMERPAVYTAPSWSWAAVHGMIEDACGVRYADERDVVLEILDARVDLVSDLHRFGQVKGGFIRARGHIARAGVHIRESTTDRGNYRLLVDDKVVGNALLDDHILEAPPATHHGFYYLPVRYAAGFESVTTRGVRVLVPNIEGIILQRASPNTQTEFVRVGRFNVSGFEADFKAACRRHSIGSLEGCFSGDQQGWGPRSELTIL